MRTLVALLLACLPAWAAASEADWVRALSIRDDASAALDRQMDEALESAAAAQRSCRREALEAAILDRLGGSPITAIELWPAMLPTSQKLKTPPAESIYRDVAHVDSLRYAGTSFRYGSVFLGSDKLGHFLQHGYDSRLYAEQRLGRRPRDLRGLIGRAIDAGLFRLDPHHQALASLPPGLAPIDYGIALGEARENSVYGLRTAALRIAGFGPAVGTGVKSYGDMVANAEGFRFWAELTEPGIGHFACEGGRWRKVRAFTWADFISPAWDESVNCSEYSPDIDAAALAARIESAARELGLERTSCPLRPGQCAEAIAAIEGRFGPERARRLISPLCRADAARR